jgi:hypothetical protein
MIQGFKDSRIQEFKNSRLMDYGLMDYKGRESVS